MISELTQCNCTTSDSRTLPNTSVTLISNILPQSLKISDGKLSGPAALHRFMFDKIFSRRVGESVSTFHSGSYCMLGNRSVAEGQLNCFSDCSAQRFSGLSWKVISISSIVVMVSPTIKVSRC
ncbi:unnamed protein product [Heterobilharzia americana]|nr:unnamed protein product [Heterobilharzia americana]CAH8463293.1 unnamed protein product [Heterobilharzia americana]